MGSKRHFRKAPHRCCGHTQHAEAPLISACGACPDEFPWQNTMLKPAVQYNFVNIFHVSLIMRGPFFLLQLLLNGVWQFFLSFLTRHRGILNFKSALKRWNFRSGAGNRKIKKRRCYHNAALAEKCRFAGRLQIKNTAFKHICKKYGSRECY